MGRASLQTLACKRRHLPTLTHNPACQHQGEHCVGASIMGPVAQVFTNINTHARLRKHVPWPVCVATAVLLICAQPSRTRASLAVLSAATTGFFCSCCCCWCCESDLCSLTRACVHATHRRCSASTACALAAISAAHCRTRSCEGQEWDTGRCVCSQMARGTREGKRRREG